MVLQRCDLIEVHNGIEHNKWMWMFGVAQWRTPDGAMLRAWDQDGSEGKLRMRPPIA